jgi:hypothetical protein
VAGRGRGGVGGNAACAIAGGIGEDGLSFVGSVQQCRFDGRAVDMDGAGLAPSAAGAYPHRTWLDTCATGLARSKPVSGELVSTVFRLDALQADGNEGTVTVESGQGERGSGGAAGDGEELELKNLCEDVVCSQLLKRVASLRRSLAPVKTKTAR